jgi:type II secretory pathway component PulF
MTFAGALRSILRHDPDIVMVGEIRDTETIDIAVKAALTGHLVLSTLHTNDAASTITRMCDMGVDPFMVSSSTLLVSAQRLMRRLCEHCRAPMEAPPERLREIGYTEEDIGGKPTFFRAVGCPRCNAGYAGRFAILETLPIRDEIKRLIVGGKGASTSATPPWTRDDHPAPLRPPQRDARSIDDRRGAARDLDDRRKVGEVETVEASTEASTPGRGATAAGRLKPREPSMPSFKYSAIGVDGRSVSGRLDAANKNECVAELRRRALTPVDIQEKGGVARPSAPSPAAPASAASGAAGANAAGSGIATAPVKSSGFSFGAVKPGVRKREEVVIFTRQLATMISAGIPMLESLEILREQAESKQFSMLLDQVIGDVRAGQDLSTALDRHHKAFTNVYVSMVRAGEASGQIDEILVRLADYMEASQRLKREIKSAMTYPIVSLVMIFSITAYLMIGIVPKFEEVFKSLDVDLPGLTRAILGCSRFCEANWPMIMAGMIFAGGLLVTYKRTEKGAYQFDWLMLHLPVFGALFRKVGLSRFAKTTATMIKSGVPILGTLEIVADTSGNRGSRRW